MNLSEFLLARIADAEALARRIEADSGSTYATVAQITYGISEQNGNVRTTEDVVVYNVAHVLAECEAKRRRVKALSERAPHPNAVPLLRKLLALEALPYADHADYDPAWQVKLAA